jgi:hypothetical protein
MVGNDPASAENPPPGPASADLEPAEEAGMPELEIRTIFRRKMLGARMIAPRERAQARREALDWLRSAMRALREKRACARHARYIARQLSKSAPVYPRSVGKSGRPFVGRSPTL